jgi:hypothetical protein
MNYDLIAYCKYKGPHSSAVVKALHYKLEGRWFEIWRGEYIFEIYLILLATLSPEVYPASNKNEKNNVSGE